MYLRYKNAPRDKVPSDLTYQMFDMDTLNKKFGTNYKYNSDILKCINRGLKEIKKITDIDISVKWQKDFDKFGFFWKKEVKKPKYETDIHAFIKHIRENIVNDFILDVPINNGLVPISCSSKGLLYDTSQTMGDIKPVLSKKIWNYLFENQNKITNLKQSKIIF